MSAIKGDFISFTYNGVHSTDLGIMQVTASNRYTDQLLPTIQDKTVQVPGGNGTYFFGSYYTQRAITINIAYDSVTEAQLREMRRVFSADTVHELIFDDEPYKIYYAKITGTPQLTYIPFDSEDAIASRGHDRYGRITQNIYERVYKGEGTLTFVCYEPFAHCPYTCKYLDQYTCEKRYFNNFIQGKLETGSGQTINYSANNSYISLAEENNGNVEIKYLSVTSNTQYKIKTNISNGTIFLVNDQNKYTDTILINNGIVIFTTKQDTVKIAVTLNQTEIKPENLSLFFISKPIWYEPSYAPNPTNWKKGEWEHSARLLNSNSGYDNASTTANNVYVIYNPGDIESDFQLIIPYNEKDKLQSIQAGGVTLMLDFSKAKEFQGSGSKHLYFNSKTNLIEGLLRDDNGKYTKTGQIFNEAINGGQWPKIPITDSFYTVNGYVPLKEEKFIINITEDFSNETGRPTLYYDYLYY